jgi:hypothetical protein
LVAPNVFNTAGKNLVEPVITPKAVSIYRFNDVSIGKVPSLYIPVAICQIGPSCATPIKTLYDHLVNQSASAILSPVPSSNNFAIRAAIIDIMSVSHNADFILYANTSSFINRLNSALSI